MPVYKKINKDFFKKITAEMVYVLGFFAADGNIVKTKRGTYFFSIQVTDKDILHKIRNLLEAEHTISVKKGIGNEKPLYRLQVGSKEMCNDLNTLGFSERKSKRMHFPDIPLKHLGHFIRGYFDGDGNVWIGYINKSRKTKTLVIVTGFTSGSKEFLCTLQYKLATVIGTTGSVCQRKNKECWCLRYSIRDSLKLYDFMYNSHVPLNGLYLSRKKAVFEKYKKMQS